MNKICTSIKQSKTLIELGIDVNTADMCYYYDHNWSNEHIKIPKIWDNNYEKFIPESEEDDIPAWSLMALLNIIPKRIKECNVLRIDISENDFAIWYDKIGFGVNTELPDITKASAVDACVEMIIKLHEQNLL